MLILNYQRMSTEDGPGLRTTLFVKGCPLRCKWCHNPESISSLPQNEWVSVSCISCLNCIKTCKSGAIQKQNEKIVIDRKKCTLCLACEKVCPTGAITIKGKKESVKAIFKELVKDRAYWGQDGGVTLSGGEILSQADEASELLIMLKNAGIHTAIDTSGLCKKEDIDKVFPYTDLFLYDIKVFDSNKHEELTGVKNDRILDNFNYITEKIKGTGKKIWVRTPIIPGSTDDEENIRQIAKFIAGRVDRYDLCAFNNLCKDKYERLYIDWEYKDSKLIKKETMIKLQEIAKSVGVQGAFWSGATRE